MTYAMRAVPMTIVFFACIWPAVAQSPGGTITGVVRDASGALVSAATVELRSTSTAFSRASITSASGNYSFPTLPAGEYEVSVQLPGFNRAVRQTVVETGLATTTDFVMQVGDVKDSVSAESSFPQMHYDSPSVNGLITRDQIEDLPLNGRNFLELAKLEPGGQPPTRQNNNRTLVPVLDAPSGNSGRGTRVTVDGGSIMAIGYTGSAMDFSQDVVQEFEVSAVGFDLATGITNQGSINVVTRSGGNDLHGTAFYFFRDHTLSAYPALIRDPTDPNPFFQRRQFGFAIGGPILRDRIFFFGNWERNEQRGVAATTLATPEFASFSRVTPTPLFGDLLSARIDARVTNSTTAFVRYSHDGSEAFSSNSAANALAYPSGWFHQLAWSDQSIMGVTTVLRPSLVNDFRFSYFFTSSSENLPKDQDCPGCLGLGAPSIAITQAGLTIGSSTFDTSLARQYQYTDALAWHRGKHQFRFGVDWEHERGGNSVWQNEPASLTLFSPAVARQYSLPVPASFTSLNDILQLPLQSFTVAVGNPQVPEEGGGPVRHWNTAHIYFQDAWRLHERLTVTYGLAWNMDRDLNYDLSKPALLAPILGLNNLGPTRKQWKMFSPVAGLAWAPFSDRKTVVRAGAGIFYDVLISSSLDPERALLGPPGLGLQTFSGTAIPNPLAGVPGVPVGRALDFRNVPTFFTGADLLSILPTIRDNLTQTLSQSNPAVQAIQVSKQAAVSGLYPADYPGPGSAQEMSAGIQREIARDFVVTADFAYRHFIHLDLGGVGKTGIDLNHYNSVDGPVIPKCATAQLNDPQALCSSGPIDVHMAAGRASYKGLLLRAEKRLAHGVQILASYAYSSTTGTNGSNGFNLDDWLQSSGPLPTDLRHVLNVSGVAHLPWRLELDLNFAYSSAPPFSAYVGGIDFDGDGTQGDLLPGTTVGAFGRGMGRQDLQRLVTQFDTAYTGRSDAQGRSVPRITLPGQYSFGDGLQSLDLRLSRAFAFREHGQVSLIGEVFNLYNAANLSGYSGDLTNPATFGQPTSRTTQVFGSGGPRAIQMAVRVKF